MSKPSSMIPSRFTPQLRNSFYGASNLARDWGYPHTNTLHLLLALLQSEDKEVILPLEALISEESETPRLGADNNPKQRVSYPLPSLQQQVEAELKAGKDEPKGTETDNFSEHAEKMLKIPYLESKILQDRNITNRHLLMALLRVDDTLAAQILAEYEVNYERFFEAVKTLEENEG